MLTLCIQGFVVSFGLGMVMPIIGVHVHKLGGNFAEVGCAYGSFFIARLFLTPLVGRLSDKRGRRSFLVSGLVLTSLAGALFLWAEWIYLLVVARALQGAAAALTFTILTACAGTVAPTTSEGRGLGTYNGSLFAGMACGVVAGAAVLYVEEASFVLPYLFVILSGLATLMLLPTLPEGATRVSATVAKDYWALLSDPLVRKLALYRAFLAMVPPALVVFLPVFVAALDLEEPTIAGIDLVMGLKRLSAGKFVLLGLVGVSAGAFQHGLGRLFDRGKRSSRVTATIIGALLASSTLFLMPHLRGFRELAAVSFLMGFSASALFLPGFLLIVKVGRRKGMGTIVGLMELAGALGAVAGSALAAMAASLNPAYLFPIAAAFPLVAAAFYVSAVRLAGKKHGP